MARRIIERLRALVLFVVVLFAFLCSIVQASPFSAPPSDNATLLPPSSLPLPRRALAQASSSSSSTSSSRCRVLALPCVSSVYVQAGAGSCAGPSAFGRDNTCCPIVRDFVEAGCACDGAFLAVASFGGWNGAKLAQAVRAILSTPCGKGLRDPSCNIACPMLLPSGKEKEKEKEKEKGGSGGSGGSGSSESNNNNGNGNSSDGNKPQPSPAQPAGSRKRTRRRRGR